MLNEYNCYKIRHMGGSIVFKFVYFEKDNNIISISNPRDINKIFKYLKCEKVCCCCGKTFIYNYKTIKAINGRECRTALHNSKKSQDGAKT